MAGSTQKKKRKSNQKKGKSSASRTSNASNKKQNGRKKISVTEGSGSRKEIGAIIAIGVCILLIISLFGKAGFIGGFFRSILVGLFGWICTFLMICVAIAAAISVLRGTEKRFFSIKKSITFALFILMCSALIQTCTNAYEEYCAQGTGFIQFINYLWSYDPIILSGGLIGGGISFLLQMLMEQIASIVVLAVLTVILANILFSFSVVSFSKKCSSAFRTVRGKISNVSDRFKEDRIKQEESEAENETDDTDAFVQDDDFAEDDVEFIYQPIPINDFDEEEEASTFSEQEVEVTYDEKESEDLSEKEEQKASESGVSSSNTAPEIHVPGTACDSSLDGLVYSKEQAVPYRFPGTDLLDIDTKKRNPAIDKNQAAVTARKLEAVMKSFGIEARVTHYSVGPSVTRYEMIPSIGVRVSKIKNLADDIALNLAATSIRIEAPIPGKSAIGIEVPNKEIRTVYFREIIESDAFRFNRSKLAACLGSGISGEPVVVDLAKMPHLMIAGTTGSGKSVCTNGIIMSILFNASPEEVKFILIDPKMVEFSKYNGIPHLLLPVVTEPKKAASALAWAVDQMEKRYKLLAMYGVRDLASYNAFAEKNGLRKMPTIVIIIDELADLMMVARDSVETAINRIAQKARAAGMHLVVATQRPSVDVITGLIKSNIPVRIALKVSSQVDSRTIIDVAGAEKLLGRGDMLYLAPGVSKTLRIQGSYVSDSEIESVVSCIMQTSTADYAADVMKKVDEGMVTSSSSDKGSDDGNLSEDEVLFRKAVKLAIDTKNISVSMLQRKFNIGFNRAGRIVDMMEERGVVSCKDGSNARKVLIDSYDFGSDE